MDTFRELFRALVIVGIIFTNNVLLCAESTETRYNLSECVLIGTGAIVLGNGVIKKHPAAPAAVAALAVFSKAEGKHNDRGGAPVVLSALTSGAIELAQEYILNYTPESIKEFVNKYVPEACKGYEAQAAAKIIVPFIVGHYFGNIFSRMSDGFGAKSDNSGQPTTDTPVTD